MKHCTPEVVHLPANWGLPTHLACCPAAEPIHLPHLIGPMKHYLWILKTTHGGQDMDTCLEMAKGSLDGKALPPVKAWRAVLSASVKLQGILHGSGSAEECSLVSEYQ